MATTSGSLEALRESKRRIPAVIRRLMRLYDVTGTDLGRALGVGRAAFYSRLQGTTVIKAEEVAALAAYLRLPVEVFYRRTRDPMLVKDLMRWATLQTATAYIHATDIDRLRRGVEGRHYGPTPRQPGVESA